MTRYTPEQRAALIAKVGELRAQGKTVAEACTEAGVGHHVYSYWISDKGKHRVKALSKKPVAKLEVPKKARKPYKLRKKAIPENNFTVEVKPENKAQFVFIVGNASDVMAAINKLGVLQ